MGTSNKNRTGLKKLRRIGYRFKKISDLRKEIPFLLKKKNIPFNPVFIIGCGRSGTTILGRSLSQHPDICYLEERRDLWHSAYPELDIWTGRSKKQPKLYANADDAETRKTKKINHLFYREQVAAAKKVLLEKMPINSFRLKFLEKCFPGARYIYLHRSGIEVAESIARKPFKDWYGNKNIKLNALINFGNMSGLPANESVLENNFHKGIYEWRLSMEQSDDFFRHINPERFIDLSYKDFTDNPSNCLKKIFTFLQLAFDENLLNKICKEIDRKNVQVTQIKDEYTREIGGSLLQETIANSYRIKKVNER